MKTILTSGFLLALLFIVGCEKDKINGDIVIGSDLASELIALSQDTIRVDNLHYRIEPYLYRDFFPGVLPKKKPLIDSISFICCDGIPFSPELKIARIYIYQRGFNLDLCSIGFKRKHCS